MFSDADIQFSKEWIKSVYDLKKSLDSWANSNLQDLWDNKFQSSFMQFLLLIEEEGKTNSELAKLSGISKQAMSKIINQLAEMGLIQLIASQKDKRSATIILSEKGRYIVQETLLRFTTLIAGYRTAINAKDIELSKQTLDLVKVFIKNQNI